MQWDLAPGAITPAAVETFTRGACAGLAIALHDATGWPIVEVGHCDGLPLHFMVRRPDGRLVDIEGAHTDEDVADEWEFCADGVVTFTDATRDAVWACYRDDCGEPVPLDLARTFVPAVLALDAEVIPAAFLTHRPPRIPLGAGPPPPAARTESKEPAVSAIPDLSDLPEPPVYPTGQDLKALLTGDDVADLRTAFRLHDDGKGAQAAWDRAAEAGALQRDGAPHARVLSALAGAEVLAPAAHRAWHAARLDAYAAAYGLRGWYRYTDFRGRHSIQINRIRTRADGDIGRYYVHAAAYMHAPQHHWVVDRDTGRTVYRSHSGRIAQQWITVHEQALGQIATLPDIDTYPTAA